jgi:L-lactate dehydrogenase complex protein LldG
MSREKILNAVMANQPALAPLPDIDFYEKTGNPVEQFMETLISIGGSAFKINQLAAIGPLLSVTNKRVATNINELSGIAGLISMEDDPHTMQDVELMILKAHFGVAENGAVWITEQLMGHRIAAFIPQHLAVVIEEKDIVPDMQYAYARIGDERYHFGSFISGPSKTADIEQALVLGAHGPRTMTAYIITN